MTLITQTSLESIAVTDLLRCGVPLLTDKEKLGSPFNVYGVKTATVPLSSLTLNPTSEAISKGNLHEPRTLIDLEHASQRGFVEGYDVVNSINSTRVEFGDADILTAKLRPYLGKSIRGNVESNAIGTPEWIPVKCDPAKLDVDFLLLTLHSRYYRERSMCLMAGKQHPRIPPVLFNSIEIPKLSIAQQQAVVAQVKPLIDEYAAIRASMVKSPNSLITNIFAEHLGWDLQKFDAEKYKSMITLSLESLAKEDDLRCSSRFYNPASAFVWKEITDGVYDQLGKIVTYPMELGSSVSPRDYRESGDYLYASMASIKNWEFDPDASKAVSDDYVTKASKKRVSSSDILMARSGEGTIGKVALYQESEDAIFSDFTIRIRVPKERASFVYHYMRTDYFQHLVYTWKKGLGNNTNIFPSQICHFPVPKLQKKIEKNIVLEIEGEVPSLMDIEEKLKAKSQEIDDLLLSAIEQLTNS